MSDSNGRLQRDKHGFIHPSTEEQIRKLIKDANNEGKKVRVRGSGHSVSGAILTDLHAENPMDEREINLVLDKYTVVRFDEARKRVTVQAGCLLVYNSKHPSEDKVGLLPRIDEKGWALPDLGGIAHQTVAGFVSTGSAGGSLQASLDPNIVAIRIIDGKGNPHDLSENNESNLFHATGVSMGLLGVISTVTFQCIDRFDIKGACQTDLRLLPCTASVDRSSQSRHCGSEQKTQGARGRHQSERYCRHRGSGTRRDCCDDAP